MRPLNLDECWICQQQFPDQKTLKRHLASKGTHGGRLSVVCLWCFSYEKRFSRISDLKCHLDEKHPDIAPKLEKTFMSEANGYWFSVFPEDYRRIVTKVTPKGSPSAVQARSHVTSWLGKCKSIRRLRQSWVEDWANHPRDTDVVGTPRQGIREPSVESASIICIHKPPCVLTPYICLNNQSLHHLAPTKASIIICTKPPSSVPKSPSSAPSLHHLQPTSAFHLLCGPVVQPPSSSTDLTLAEETPIQKKAREILTLGSMPAIPPARRDWKTKSIKIPTGSTFLQWPPREWETLTPDSKLLAWEFAASQLEYHSTGKFPKLDRVDLLDKYNFLALPGTKEQKIKGKENLVRKCRYYNYEILRTTINKDNPDFKIIVNQLFITRDSRDTSTDKIIDLCNHSKIPLRLL
ncbi:unnamed protein product [Mytilus edulis]|uniref:Uncharacterized protein n=1 Tax=Mytilus edulis TaxID=6550 RepID=A0A8S3SBN0_MYTED|nr:unnamed protein product [Mytilus edulis]